MRKVIVGVIGCGVISNIYLKNLTGLFGGIVEVKAVADLMPEAARKQADKYGIPFAYTPDELFADEEIEIVVNLTNPKGHGPLNMAALRAGKHVYVEKPFAVELEEAAEVLALARDKGLRVGGAPDTFLGGGLQTCRKLIDEGAIGKPLHAHALIVMVGPADYDHPNPQAFLGKGGGPLLDLGPYYVAALASIFGPVTRVSGSAQTPEAEIVIRNPQSPKLGQSFVVESPTNVTGVLDFASGLVASVTATNGSFGYHPRLEVYGTEGILTMNDPNMFGGDVTLFRASTYAKEAVAAAHPMNDDSRGAGVADMARAIIGGGAHRANGELAYHSLEVMHAIVKSSQEGRHVSIESRFERPAPVAETIDVGTWG
ncbi:Gfo/Idh/MocA family protein [Cohnella sp. GCM10027633]|uniref:Gfo/Idh/MocA family protein n=1 Tax=unclassified Cohnella TaxID=2636738 RepID=UPI00362D488D